MKDRLSKGWIKAKEAIGEIDLKKVKEDFVKEVAECAAVAQKTAQETVSKISETVQEKAEEYQVAGRFQELTDRATETYRNVKCSVVEGVENVRQGVLDLASRVAESEAMVKATEGYHNLMNSKVVNATVDKASGIMKIVGDKVDEVMADERTQEILSATTKVAQKTGQVTAKGLKVISGVQAVQDRKKSITTKEEAQKLKEEIEIANEAIRDDLNETLEDFGSYKVLALKRTVGVFLDYLDRMNQKSKEKEYEFLRAIDIRQEEVKEMEKVDMQATDAIKTLAVGGGFAAIGIAGTPAVVTALVTNLCVASTGTAISTLSGAAATNAVLAWLGGGTVAAGGGGMAAGTIVMGALTATATAGLAVIAVGTLASSFYSKKATEAAQYLADVKVWAAETEKSWTVLNGIKGRALELRRVTEELEKRAVGQLTKLETMVDSFDSKDNTQVECFRQAAIMVKSMSELAQTSILDADGNFNEQANVVIAKTEKILNKNL